MAECPCRYVWEGWAFRVTLCDAHARAWHEAMETGSTTAVDAETPEPEWLNGFCDHLAREMERHERDAGA